MPRKGIGAWARCAKLITEGAGLLGKQLTIKILLEGEKSGESVYKEALQDVKLSSEFRTLIETKLLPAQQSHVRSLDRLLDATAAKFSV